MLPCLRLKGLSDIGFLSMTVMFASFAACETFAPERSELLFVLLVLTTATMSWGVNVSTFVLPAVLFPCEIRGSAHGVSAACGKAGAVVGTFMYKPIANFAGLSTVLWVQCAFSLIGLAVSRAFIPHRAESVLQDLAQGDPAARSHDEHAPLLGSESIQGDRRAT